jgi:hypothetical protein
MGRQAKVSIAHKVAAHNPETRCLPNGTGAIKRNLLGEQLILLGA